MKMIAEPGILSPSSWSSDGIFGKDSSSDLLRSYFNANDNNFDLGLELDSNRAKNNSRIKKEDFSSSCSPSSTSSVCSEDLSEFIGKPNYSAHIISDHDYLSTTLNLLDDDSMSFSDGFDWGEHTLVSGIDNFLSSDSIFNDSDYDNIVETSDVPVSPSKPKRCIDPVQDDTSWSSMAINEQLIAIEDLTNVISNQLGLREQLDIIRIIEPTARVSPSDTEFVIDLNIINDQKLCRVRDYVKKVQANQKHQKRDAKHKNHHRKDSSWRSNGSSSTLTSQGVSTSKSEGTRGKNSKNKSKELKERHSPKVIDERKTKEHRQMLKEKRSGLFVREEVLNLTVMRKDEDSDIDILG